MERRGFILIADITGYTSYLNRSELEHAQGTLTDLLQLLIEHTRPPLVISRLEGDAVVSYGLSGGFAGGQTLLEQIEETYLAFRRAIDLMVLNNTCRCNACANVPSLDLKFFLHHGSFLLQRLGEHEEMLGRDVNLIHRLLKNSVTEKTGIRAYMMCTEAAIEALGLEESEETATRLVEEVADFGEVTVWVRDMHPLYQERAAEQQIVIEDHEVLSSLSTEIGMSPELVWDYLHQTEYRNVILGSDRTEVVDRRGGRIAPGSTFQCFHGDKVLPQIVLEWRPFERVVIQQVLPFPGRPSHMLIEFRLQPSERGTLLTQRIARPSGAAWKRAAISFLSRTKRREWQQDMDAFRDRIEEDRAGQPVEQPIEITPELLTAAAAAGLRENQSGG